LSFGQSERCKIPDQFNVVSFIADQQVVCFPEQGDKGFGEEESFKIWICGEFPVFKNIEMIFKGRLFLIHGHEKRLFIGSSFLSLLVILVKIFGISKMGWIIIYQQDVNKTMFIKRV
jgi:hypothetical protein